MGPWAGLLLLALGIKLDLAMEGSGSGAASASSGAGTMLRDPGAAASGPSGRSIHGHMALDGEEMEDALLRSQMEWLQRHLGRLHMRPMYPWCGRS